MMMKKIWLIALCLATIWVGKAQKQVLPLPADSNTVFGKNYFLYALPQTVFQLDVVVTRQQEMCGVYADYADKLLGLNHIVKKNRTTYSLKSAQLTPLSVPDEAYVFAVELSEAQCKAGFLQQLYENQVVTAVSNAPTYRVQSAQIPDFFRYYSDLSYTEQENNYVETQIVDGVVRQVPASKVQKITKSNDQKAQEAADKVAKIRKDRYALLAGEQEIAYDAATLAQMVEELNALERNYLSLFAGFVVEEELHYTLWVTPTEEATPCAAFSVSPTEGFSTAASTPDNTYYLHFAPQVQLNVREGFTNARANSKKYKADTGYRIRRAVAAHVSLQQANQVLFSYGDFPVYQFGKMETLPAGFDTFDINKFAIIY